mgnify:FL=1
MLGRYEQAHEIFMQRNESDWAELAKCAFVGLQKRDNSLLARASWLAMVLDRHFGAEVAKKLSSGLPSKPTSDDERLLIALKWLFANENLIEANDIFQNTKMDPLAARLLTVYKRVASKCIPGHTPGIRANNLFCSRWLPCRYESYRKLYKLYEQHPYNFDVIHHLAMYQMSLRRYGCFDFSTKTHPLSPFQSNGHIAPM